MSGPGSSARIRAVPTRITTSDSGEMGTSSSARQTVLTTWPEARATHAAVSDILDPSGGNAGEAERAPLDDAAAQGLIFAEIENRQGKVSKAGRISRSMASTYSVIRSDVVEQAGSRGEWAGYLFDLCHYNHRTNADLRPEAPPLP